MTMAMMKPDFDANEKDVLGNSHLHNCILDGHVDVLNLLLKHPDIEINVLVIGNTKINSLKQNVGASSANICYFKN